MKLNDILRVGQVIEVKGQKIKALVDTDKNTTYLNYNGENIKNISINGYVGIRKGFLNIIGKVEGEYIHEKREDTNAKYENKGNHINRIIEISILGSLNHKEFKHGLVELPLIGNYVYILDEEDIKMILSYGSTKKLKLGTLIDYQNYPFEIDIQNLFCSHIGIFGNTGSGKSNTVAKLYNELFKWCRTYTDLKKFKENSEFIFIDFNNEYGNTFEEVNYYNLTTHEKLANIHEDDKYLLEFEEVFDVDFWAMVLEATDKTQKPFLNRVIRKVKNFNQDMNFSRYDLATIILNAQEHFSEIKHNLEEVFHMVGMNKEFLDFQEKINFNTYSKKFYIEANKSKENKADYEIDLNKIYFALFANELDIDSDKDISLTLNLKKDFFKFRFILNYEYCLEISKGYITSQHIGPVLGRAASKIEDLEKIFSIHKGKNSVVKDKSNISIIALGDLNTSMKKLVPMIICKTKYEKKKKKRGNSTIKSSLHLIIDEAHNILSNMSTRESEVWKDYRLECFEEIIKEGRKFGTFLTIASQRPSDISDTIISQLHNYFIHRLVNEEDLRKIYKSVAFADKVSNEMIPVLPAGGCLFSGVSTNFPILAKIDKLPDNKAPNSKNVNLFEIWGLEKIVER